MRAISVDESGGVLFMWLMMGGCPAIRLIMKMSDWVGDDPMRDGLTCLHC